ncbi:MAG: MBL fold metallo-hydrolase [Woeseiaceae bacterium]|nr:MBL fold metallo-hydrolase [Woeseiaceae bacterium]
MSTIRYEFDNRPRAGETLQVADGLHWLRMPLPFALDHINLWLIEDDTGWVTVDTGLATSTTRAHWEQVFEGLMQGRPLTHVVATHLHPDHVGCAGWLVDRFDVDLWMTRDEYLLCRILVSDTGKPAPDEGRRFYHGAGFSGPQLKHYIDMFGSFGRVVSPMPEAFKRLHDGEKVRFGRHDWEIIVGRGHSPEHACLFCEDCNVLISGDQLLPTISSNVSVWPTEPGANPLKAWIESLQNMQGRLPADVLVLPAHGKPFRGAKPRLQALIDEHVEKLGELRDWCRKPRRAVDTFPALYKARIGDNNRIMATGEAIAHLNYLVAEDLLIAEADDDGIIWYQSH